MSHLLERSAMRPAVTFSPEEVTASYSRAS
jgi:hypothetical protein